MDHQLVVTPVVRVTRTHDAVWTAKLTISGVPVPVQVATVVKVVPLDDTPTV
jgi:hypothetical protein